MLEAQKNSAPWQAQWNIQLGGGYTRSIQGQAVLIEKRGRW